MILDNQVVEQAVIVNKSKMKSDQASTKLALFNENGTPVSFGASAIATEAPAELGASAAVGTSAKAAREDHVHARPTLAELGAAAATHEHTLAEVTGLQAIIDDLTARVEALEPAG